MVSPVDSRAAAEKGGRMRVAFCIPRLDRSGGMERIVTERANYLVQHTDWEVWIVMTESADGDSLSFFPLDERVRWVTLNIDLDADFRSGLLRKSIQHIRKQRIYRQRLTGWLKEEQIELCVSLGGKEVEWLGRQSMSCRKWVEWHFAYGHPGRMWRLYHRGIMGRIIGWILNRRQVMAARRMDGVIVLNEAERRLWQQEGLQRVVCVPNPCRVMPDTEPSSRLKQVLAVGRLYPMKGFDRLIRAWSEVATRYPDWKLKIVGEGEDRMRLQEQIDRLGLREVVELVGACHDMEPWYRQSRLFVLSSLSECMPLCLMEAMGSACCVVSVDCPNGPRELIREGDTGRLVPMGDVHRLAEVLMAQMEDEVGSAEMGLRAQTSIRQHFGMESIMEQWIQVVMRK